MAISCRLGVAETASGPPSPVPVVSTERNAASAFIASIAALRFSHSMRISMR